MEFWYGGSENNAVKADSMQVARALNAPWLQAAAQAQQARQAHCQVITTFNPIDPKRNQASLN
jgi:hypothetical protein